MGVGIKNMMSMYTRTLLNRLEGHSEAALEEGRQRLKMMVREGRTALFLESIGIDVGPKGVSRSIGQAIEQILDGQQIEVDPQVLKRSKKRRHGSGMVAVRISEAALEAERKDAEGPAQMPQPSAEERQEREREITVEELSRPLSQAAHAEALYESKCGAAEGDTKGR
jgi:hypothetical protein